MSTRVNNGAAWTCGLMLLTAGTVLIGLQLEQQAIAALGIRAFEQPAVFKLILAAEAIAVVSASALLMVAIRDWPRRERLRRIRRQRAGRFAQRA